MNPNWGSVDNILDLLNNVWIGVVVICAAAVPSWFAARNHKNIQAIRDNVQNGHTVPMRADLDRAIAAIEALGQDIHALRADLHEERNSRQAQVEDLRSDVDRMRRR